MKGEEEIRSEIRSIRNTLRIIEKKPGLRYRTITNRYEKQYLYDMIDTLNWVLEDE